MIPSYIQDHNNQLSMMSDQQLQSSSYQNYRRRLQDKLASIFVQFQDSAPANNLTINRSSLGSKLRNRESLKEQILFQNYPMVKKGKKFNTLQERTFKIDNQQIYQVDKNGTERKLPFPIRITQQDKESSQSWEAQGYAYRLSLQFDQRTPIDIYFEDLLNCRQIKAFLIYKMRPSFRETLQTCSQKLKSSTIEHFKVCLKETGESGSFALVRKNRELIKEKIWQSLHKQYTNSNAVKHLIYQWAKKSKSINQIGSKDKRFEKCRVMELKMRIESLGSVLKLSNKEKEERQEEENDIVGGEIKIWVGSTTHKNKICLNEVNLKTIEKQIKMSKDYTLIFRKLSINSDNQIALDQNLTKDTCIQFQLELKKNSENSKNETWKSQRIYLQDLILRQSELGKGPKIIMLYSRQKRMTLQLYIFSCVSNLRCKNKTSSYLNHQSMSSLTPIDYPIIRELVPEQLFQQFASKFNQQKSEFSEKTVRNLYTGALYRELLGNFENEQSTSFMSFRIYQQFYNQLDICSLVQKFFINYPFCQYINVKFPGTFVYQYLAQAQHLSKSLKMNKTLRNFKIIDIESQSTPLYYYDTEKFMWKHQQFNTRRFFSALKTFDEIPRINFTQPFYWLCIRCLQIAYADPSQNYDEKSNLKYDECFENSVMGRQSMAFFLVLALVKQSSSLLLYQPNKKSLSRTTFLFHNVLKMCSPEIYGKILKTQINIESFFGIQMASLLSSLLNMEAFSIVLQRSIVERSSSRITKQPVHLTFAATFLSIIQLAHKYHKNSCLYLSAQHYLNFIRRFSRNSFISKHLPEFMFLLECNYETCSEYLENPDYNQLLGNLEKFYSNQQYAVDEDQENSHNTSIYELNLGEILEKLYNSFTCYKHKNENDIRKIFIVLNNIILGKFQLLPINSEDETDKIFVPQIKIKPVGKSLVIAIYQGSTKVYYHEFVNIEGQQGDEEFKKYDKLDQNIEIKLVKLQKLEVVIYEKYNGSISEGQYRCYIDPREVPSNYYIQEQYGLKYCSKNQQITKLNNRMFDFSAGSYIQLQIYIKDSCEVQFIQNIVPQAYIPNFLLRHPNWNILSSPKQSPQKQNSAHQNQNLQKIREDIIFCNRYFRSYRMPENNFNLLYSKLGWYGNHYLIPDDRIANFYKIKSVNPQKQELISETLRKQKTRNTVEELSVHEQQRAYTILFYSRCLYGKGIIPKVNFIAQHLPSHIQYHIQATIIAQTNLQQTGQTVKSVNSPQKFDLVDKSDAVWYNSTGKTVGYLLNNFVGPTNNFIGYYWKMINSLPLIRYLGFRTREFYVLPSLKFPLNCKIPLNSTANKGLISTYNKQESSYTQIHSNRLTNYVKNKILPSNKSLHKVTNIIKESGEYFLLQKFILILNNEIKCNKATEEEATYKFLEFKDINENEVNELTIIFNEYLQNNLVNQQERSHFVFRFTFPETQIYLDQFYYLLKLNIAKYYFQPLLQTKKPKQSPTKQSKKQGQPKFHYYIRNKETLVPNMRCYQLLQIIFETQYDFQLEISYQTNSSKSINKFQKLHRNYKDRFCQWAYLDNTWKPVAVLAFLRSPNYFMAVIEVKHTLIKKLVDISRMNLNEKPTEQREHHFHGVKLWKFTDKEIFSMEKCVQVKLGRFDQY